MLTIMTAMLLCVACGEKSVVDVVEKMYDDGITRVQKAEEMNDVQQIYDEVTKQVNNFKGEHLKEFASLESSTNALQKARETFVKACCIKLNSMGSSLQTENGLLSIDENGNFYDPLDFAGDDNNSIADDSFFAGNENKEESEVSPMDYYEKNGVEEKLNKLIQSLDMVSYTFALQEHTESVAVIKENGEHVVKYKNDSIIIYNSGAPYSTVSFSFWRHLDRHVLLNGKKVKYKPGVKTEDLSLYAIKEAVYILAENSLYSDPTPKGDVGLSEYMYYLIMRDNSVDKVIKEKAMVHFLVAAEQYLDEENNLFIMTSQSPQSYLFQFCPSHLTHKYKIYFRYDNNGYLLVSSGLG